MKRMYTTLFFFVNQFEFQPLKAILGGKMISYDRDSQFYPSPPKKENTENGVATGGREQLWVGCKGVLLEFDKVITILTHEIECFTGA